RPADDTRTANPTGRTPRPGQPQTPGPQKTRPAGPRVTVALPAEKAFWIRRLATDQLDLVPIVVLANLQNPPVVAREGQARRIAVQREGAPRSTLRIVLGEVLTGHLERALALDPDRGSPVGLDVHLRLRGEHATEALATGVVDLPVARDVRHHITR